MKLFQTRSGVWASRGESLIAFIAFLFILVLLVAPLFVSFYIIFVWTGSAVAAAIMSIVVEIAFIIALAIGFG